jgi:hypothetical protein
LGLHSSSALHGAPGKSLARDVIVSDDGCGTSVVGTADVMIRMVDNTVPSVGIGVNIGLILGRGRSGVMSTDVEDTSRIEENPVDGFMLAEGRGDVVKIDGSRPS